MIGETIRVIITGVCTFVGADVGDNNRPLTAVFPNASHHRPFHRVSLIIPDDEYDVESEPAAKVKQNEMGKRFRIVSLDNRIVALGGVTAPEFRVVRAISEEAARKHRPMDLKDLESVKWIPSLGHSWPRFFPIRSTRRIRPGFFSTAADPNLVAATFELPNGILTSHWVSGDVWRFGPRSWMHRAYETAIAQEVRFQTTVRSKTVHFDLFDLETRTYSGFVRITRKGPEETEPMQVVMANVPDDDLLPDSIIFCGEYSTSECKDKNDPFPCTCVDHHFSNYYHAMTSNMPERPSLPRRVERFPPLLPVALRVGGGNCAPSGYPTQPEEQGN